MPSQDEDREMQFVKEATTCHGNDGISDHGMSIDVCVSNASGAARVSLQLPAPAPPVTLRQSAAPAITNDAISAQAPEAEESGKPVESPASDAQASQQASAPSPDSYPNTDASVLSDWQPVD